MQKFLTGFLLTTHKIHTYTFWPKKGLKCGIFSSLIVEVSYTRGPLQPPKLIYTNKSKLLKGLKLCILPHKKKKSYTRGRCLGPLSRAFPLDPIRGPIGGPWPHSWVLALCNWCFSRQAIPKSWKPCYTAIPNSRTYFLGSSVLNAGEKPSSCWSGT